MELLDELHEYGATIVMVTHDARFAKQAKRTIGLLDGAEVTPEDARESASFECST